ncbi:hypothetical protein CDQ96_01510 [Borrelia miyamotoi]|uniref:Cell division protein FtsL n=1 Tax=Borrelia miyamotoi TaxID=47466 RepID=A0AAQ2X0V6_9SPIR|nr:hypothetical protein [Borrelia miyamotoi]AGT27301.1 hypothetical protein I871_01615 [Borrelia miyamotoi LB-2001]AJA58485.1 hypothetical protein RJ61_01495 [Borrelia miyamotoi]AOW95561.1 hypothetical protein AXH25_01505 [Borrelia miyamotoi]ASQ29106.1 hypothetical protein CDQ96_01510 [Borrelia miyamotoi]QTL83445.1 hypothetical protein bmLB2001_000298 [Borrelia miyamotoi]
MSKIGEIEVRLYYLLILVLTIIMCLNIYLNFRYVVKLREFDSLNYEQGNIIDENLRLLTIIYELQTIDRIEELSRDYLDLERKDNKDINVIKR